MLTYRPCTCTCSHKCKSAYETSEFSGRTSVTPRNTCSSQDTVGCPRPTENDVTGIYRVPHEIAIAVSLVVTIYG